MEEEKIEETAEETQETQSGSHISQKIEDVTERVEKRGREYTDRLSGHLNKVEVGERKKYFIIVFVFFVVAIGVKISVSIITHIHDKNTKIEKVDALEKKKQDVLHKDIMPKKQLDEKTQKGLDDLVKEVKEEEGGQNGK
jgi:hypothetical protein